MAVQKAFCIVCIDLHKMGCLLIKNINKNKDINKNKNRNKDKNKNINNNNNNNNKLLFLLFHK